MSAAHPPGRDPRPRRDPGAAAQDVPGSEELVLLDASGQRALALNATGAAVWDLLDGTRGVDELAAVLAEAYPDVPRQTLEADVSALLEQLEREGFLARE